MSKDSSNKGHKGKGAKLVGSPEKMIGLLITGNKEKEWAADLLINHGSKHKQVLTAMLLNRLHKLVQTIEKSTGTKFVMQEGFEFSTENDEVLPILMPINLDAGIDAKKIMKAISHTPQHEALAYSIYMQVVEWAIKSSVKNIASSQAKNSIK